MRYFKRLPYLVRILLIATVVSFTVVICGALLMRFSTSNSPVKATINPTPASIVYGVPTDDFPVGKTPVIPPDNSIAVANPTPTPVQPPIATQLAYGHFPYSQADTKQVMTVGSYATGTSQRFEFLKPEAGFALMQMIYAAREEGVWITPVSGFRTIAQQQKLFQEQIKRRGSAQEAAKLSAPAGYSEHHTGFAVDLADGKLPRQDLTFDFEMTDAYLWLTRRAQEFGFELSFPRNNRQGVSFEPWHWRYVGSPNAAATFANARKEYR